MGISESVDGLYGTRGAIARFERNHPHEPVLSACACKGRKAEPGAALEKGWGLARRAVLLVTERALRCGDWEIPFDSIERLSYSSFQGIFSSGLVLSAETREGECYQFGTNKNSSWLEQFPVEAVEGPEFKVSALRVWAVRIGVAVMLVETLLRQMA